MDNYAHTSCIILLRSLDNRKVSSPMTKIPELQNLQSLILCASIAQFERMHLLTLFKGSTWMILKILNQFVEKTWILIDLLVRTHYQPAGLQELQKIDFHLLYRIQHQIL